MMLLPRLGQWVIRRGRINPLKIQTMGYSSSAAEQSKLSTESSHANTPQGSLHIDGRTYPRDAKTNAPPAILAKTTARLHLRPHSPLHILKEKIQEYFQSADFPKGTYSVHDALHPVATTVANFDDLRIPADHPGRSHSDTYYINSTHVLRTHTSAHQSTLLKSKASSGYLVTADVYRRDEIDSCHYPVFHQMEGVRLFKRDQNKDLTEELENNKPQTNGASKKSLAMTVQDVEILSPNNTFQETHSSMEQTLVMMHLKSHLQELMASLFSADPKLEMRWIEGSFPFTQPSWLVLIPSQVR